MAENEPSLEQQIEEMAGLQFSESEIVTIVGITITELREKHTDEMLRGRLCAEAEVRRSILQLAKQGSTPAQKQFLELNAAAKRRR